MSTTLTSVTSIMPNFRFRNTSTFTGSSMSGPFVDNMVYNESRTRNSVPGYASKIRLGQNATGVYSRIVINLKLQGTITQFMLIYKQPAGEVRSNNYIGHAFGPQVDRGFPPDTTAATTAALTDVYRKIRSEQVKMSGMTFLGEIREAAHMIRRPAETLFRSVFDYASASRKRTKGIRNNARKVNKVLSDTWLEYSFGWVPLMNDISDGISAYADVINGGLTRSRARGYGTSTQRSKSTSSTQLGFAQTNLPWFWAQTQTEIEDVVECWYTVGMTSTRKGNTPSDVAERFGFKASEFIPTVWELIPYSFLVDYFSNVGNILEASATDTSSVTWISRGVKRVRSHTYRVYPDLLKAGQALGSIFIDSSAAGHHQLLQKVTWFDRTSPAQLTIPRLTVTYPGQRVGKWLNLAALASVRIL
jgi:hypothetical protein